MMKKIKPGGIAPIIAVFKASVKHQSIKGNVGAIAQQNNKDFATAVTSKRHEGDTASRRESLNF